MANQQRERVFQTNGGDVGQGPVIDLNGVQDMQARVKKITTTDEGKLQIVLEGDVIRQQELEKIRDLFLIQQGMVYVDFTPAQGELDL